MSGTIMAGSTVQWQRLEEEGGPDPITMPGTCPTKPSSLDHQDHSDITTSAEDNPGSCGILSWTPSWLQRFATPNTFFGMVCACIMVEVAGHTGYVGGVLSTIEKNFQLKSSEVAFVTVINHIGAFTAIVTSYIGNKTHRPRAIAIGVEIMGIGQFICALPHFLTDSRTTNPTSSSSMNSSLLLCGGGSGGVEASEDATGNNATYYEHMKECELQGEESILAHAWLLILGELITGIGSGPVMPLLITYIDDCVGKVKVSVYVGILFACAATGPVFGYLLSALTLSYHVNFDRQKTTSISPSDPGWVGAWWLGFLILGPLMMLMAPVLCLFPKEMVTERNKMQPDEEIQNGDDTHFRSSKATSGGTIHKAFEAIMAYLGALRRLITNLVFICITLSTTGLVIAGLGQFYFGAKYLETQFSLTTWTASLILAAMCLPGTLFGILLGGYVVKRWKLTTPAYKCAQMSVTMGVTSCILLPVLFCLGCTNSHFAGLTMTYPSSLLRTDSEPVHRAVPRRYRDFTLADECNSMCECSQRNFEPVCGSNGVTFANPCYAGCMHMMNETIFSNCSCIPLVYDVNEGVADYGSAVLGVCIEMCATVIPYAVLYAIAGFCMALSQNPNYMVTLRSLETHDRAVGLGMNAVIMRLLGNLLGPMYFGVAIDAACLEHQTNDCGKQGACLVYDLRKYRYIFVGMLFVFVIMHTCCVGIVYFTLKKRHTGQPRQHVRLEERISDDISRTSSSHQEQEPKTEEIDIGIPIY